MEIELLNQKMKEIYSLLMDFIDSTENTDVDLLINNIKNHEIIIDKCETISTLQLLSKIADNHHLLPDFLEKIKKIMHYLIKQKVSDISDYEIYKIFKNNKYILLLLLEQEFIHPDKNIINDIMISKDKNNFPYRHYLYSGIKSYIDENKLKMIESEINKNYEEELPNFETKCRIGENDSYICSLIRQDSVKEFISYINRTKTSISTQIQPSIYETNSFLMGKRPTLIEYASFFGSIQIIQYLRLSKVYLTNSLWLYSIHSNNPELIHFLEENEIIPHEDMYKESILCHHNDIAIYIKDNFQDQIKIDHL